MKESCGFFDSFGVEVLFRVFVDGWMNGLSASMSAFVRFNHSY